MKYIWYILQIFHLIQKTKFMCITNEGIVLNIEKILSKGNISGYKLISESIFNEILN